MTKSEALVTSPASWPVYSVKPMPIGELIPYARNAKQHSDEQVRALAALIREFGWTMPILIDETGEIIAGHGRVLAAHHLGLTEVPVAVAEGWTEAQRRAYRIADNRLAELSTWDDELLRIEIGELHELGADLTLTGFDTAAIEAMLSLPDTAGESLAATTAGGGAEAGRLADRFGIAPFSVLNAREGWWQDRKRAWIALGIESELGRGAPVGGSPMPGVDAATGKIVRKDMGADAAARARANAEPGGSKMPAANYSKTKARGDGRGRAVT